MPLVVKIKGKGGGVLDVNGEGQIPVVVHPHPPKGEQESAVPFQSYFKNASDSSDMLVDGTTPVDFFIEAEEERDIYVKSISVFLSDASASLSEFLNLNTALTNGVAFCWVSTDLGTVVIADELKTNFAFVRLALGQPAFGDSAGAFRASNVAGVSGNAEGYLPVIDLAKTFGLQYGLRLRKGSKDKVVFQIRDDLTGATDAAFNAIGYGLKI